MRNFAPGEGKFKARGQMMEATRIHAKPPTKTSKCENLPCPALRFPFQCRSGDGKRTRCGSICAGSSGGSLGDNQRGFQRGKAASAQMVTGSAGPLSGPERPRRSQDADKRAPRGPKEAPRHVAKIVLFDAALPGPSQEASGPPHGPVLAPPGAPGPPLGAAGVPKYGSVRVRRGPPTRSSENPDFEQPSYVFG